MAQFVPHHSEHVEASLAQQVAQVGDGGVGGHVGAESSLPLGLGELEGAAQLVQGLPAHHRPNEHPVWFQHLMDLRGGEVRNQPSQQGGAMRPGAAKTDFITPQRKLQRPA